MNYIAQQNIFIEIYKALFWSTTSRWKWRCEYYPKSCSGFKNNPLNCRQKQLRNNSRAKVHVPFQDRQSQQQKKGVSESHKYGANEIVTCFKLFARFHKFECNLWHWGDEVVRFWAGKAEAQDRM